MKMNKILFAILLFTFVFSCNQSTKKINHDDTITIELKRDSSKIEIADLPILIDSTDYLIHPIGNITETRSGFSSYGSGGSYTSYSVSRHNKYSITGEFSNVHFQNIGSEKLRPLTNKIIEITSINFLENIRRNTALEYLVYTVRDSDTNKNQKIDYSDVVALYISKIDGSNFKKLTPDLDQIVDWKIIPELNRLYLKSIEDTNKNGEFDKEDKINYNYVYLKDTKLEVKSYDPI